MKIVHVQIYNHPHLYTHTHCECSSLYLQKTPFKRFKETTANFQKL